MEKIQIAAILPVYNRITETISCLNRLNALNDLNLNLHTILVDDGSTDGTSKYVSLHFPEVKIIHGNGNLWWAGGVNEGLKYIKRNLKVTYILILNNDSFFTNDDFWNILNIVFDNENTVCSAVVVDQNTDLIYNAGMLQKGFFKELKPQLYGNPISSYKNHLLKCDSLCTNFLIMPAKIIYDIGYFNTNKFQHGFSDFEYFLRAKIFGYKLFVNTNSKILTIQNSNYLNKRLINQNLISFIKSFFDLKYGTYWKQILFSSFCHKPFLLGLLTYIKNMTSIFRWVIIKLVLKDECLIKIVSNKWQI